MIASSSRLISFSQQSKERSCPHHLYNKFHGGILALHGLYIHPIDQALWLKSDVPCLDSLESHPHPTSSLYLSRVEYTLWSVAPLEIYGMQEGHSPVEACFFSIPSFDHSAHIWIYALIHTFSFPIFKISKESPPNTMQLSHLQPAIHLTSLPQSRHPRV